MSKSPWQLEALASDDFRDSFAQIGTVDGIYYALKRSPEVKTLTCTLREETIDSTELDRFVRRLLLDFEQGRQFEHQIALAGIAVACEPISQPYAQEFIEYLSSCGGVELQLSSQVADLVGRHREAEIPQ